MQTLGEILEVLKRKDTNIKKISKESGISSDRLYSWRQGRGTPKAEDAAKLMEWAKSKGDSYNKLVEIQPKVEELQTGLKEAAKGKDMEAMFLMLIEHLQTISTNLSETKRLTQANNSLAQTVLLKMAQEKAYDPTEARKLFQGSLDVAEQFLRQNFERNLNGKY